MTIERGYFWLCAGACVALLVGLIVLGLQTHNRNGPCPACPGSGQLGELSMTVIPMGGESVSIEQANEDTPFAVIRPTETPGGTQLVDVRVSQSPDGKDRDVLLFYGTSRPSEDASIEDWMLAGGIVIIETTHRWSESYVDQLYDRYGSDEYPTSYVKSIADLDVILIDAGWKLEAVMYRENLMYDVVVSPRFTMGELEMIAASIAEQIQAPSR